MKQKAILITGVAGMIGSNFADWLSANKKEYEIVGIDSLFGGYIENVNKDVVFYQRELVKDDISDIFKRHNIEYVFHFAAYAAEGLSPFIRKFNYENNMVSTANVVNECINHNVKRLVYTSSMSVYGHGESDRRFEEIDIPHPIDPYGISKYACEMDIDVANKQHGLDYCIIRPHNVIGKKQNIWDKYRNVIGIWMYQILHNQPMTIYGDGEQTRAFTYVDDIMEPLWNAATYDKASCQIINLGGTVEYSLNNACKMVSEITGYNNIEYKEARFEAKRAIPSFNKSIEYLDFKPNTNLFDGIKDMWEWSKKQDDKPQYKWESYEIEKGIYSYWK